MLGSPRFLKFSDHTIAVKSTNLTQVFHDNLIQTYWANEDYRLIPCWRMAVGGSSSQHLIVLHL